MQINLNRENILDLSTVEYGDVVLTVEGGTYLIVADVDNDDFVAVDLKNNLRSGCRVSVSSLFEFELEEKPVRIIKADNLKLGVY